MSGPKRNPDKLNTIGVVVVGVCGAVLAYVTIVALQAFYMNDTSDLQNTADYGGQEITAKSHKAAEMGNITQSASNPAVPGGTQTYRIPIKYAIDDVIESAKADPGHLVPAMPRADKPTIQPIFGRPKLLVEPAPPPPPSGAGAGSGSATGPATTAPATAPTGSSPGAGSGSGGAH